jgi:TonB-linked SusC/RagA family outer membrane protein
VNYNFKGKYLFSGSMRADGSSRFGANNKFGYFPAGSVGWILTEEDFLKNNSTLSFLKVKASFGYTGNAEIGDLVQWGTTDVNSGIVYNNDTIIYRTNLSNPDITWERTFSYDLGIEFGLLRDRIYGEVTYYNKTTRDMLLQVKTPISSGWGLVYDNVGSMENKGFEVMIKSRNLVGAFQWTTDLNLGFNRNEVLDVGTASPDALAGTGDTRVIKGYPIGVNYLVQFSHVDPEDGMPVFLTKDGEETKEYDVDDRVVVGKPYPDLIGGLTNTFSWKGFELSFLFNFSYGNDIYDDAGKRLVGRINGWNQSRMVLDRWRQPGDDTTIPRLTFDGALSGIETDRNTTEFLYDGSYLRLKQLTFGYSFPEAAKKALRVENLRIFFAGTNLLTFTKYPGSDPEIFRDMENVMQKNLSPSVTYLTPPQAKTFNLGVNVTF